MLDLRDIYVEDWYTSLINETYYIFHKQPHLQNCIINSSLKVCILALLCPSNARQWEIQGLLYHGK